MPSVIAQLLLPSPSRNSQPPCVKYLGSDQERLSEAGDAFYVERELLEDRDGVESFVHLDGQNDARFGQREKSQRHVAPSWRITTAYYFYPILPTVPPTLQKSSYHSEIVSHFHEWHAKPGMPTALSITAKCEMLKGMLG